MPRAVPVLRDPSGVAAAPRVLMAAAEAYPLVKTGGLADVIGALPRALGHAGVDARLALPGYACVLDALRGAKTIDRACPAGPFGTVRLLESDVPEIGARVIAVDAPALFRRAGGPYQDGAGVDWADNGLRFATFAYAIGSIALGRSRLAWRPGVVHCHDWHAALVPLLIGASAPRPATVLTLHNLAFQGNFPLDLAADLAIPPAALTPDGVEFHGRLSLLKAGLIFADRLTTVSPTYAREILTPEFGCGLDGVIRARADAPLGIVNGIDSAVWDPARDAHVACPFTPGRPAGRAACKADLQRRLGLAVDAQAPLAVSVSRLTHQKMIDVLIDALPRLLERNERLQLAVLGRGERALEERLVERAAAFAGRAAVVIGYTEPDAHRFLAGADMLVHGSRFEPCGLTQLYAMRYGALPIVRRVGGLSDTVVDADAATLADGSATGFAFDGDTPDALVAAVERAVRTYADEPRTWRRMQRRAMTRDCGWAASARRYAELFATLAGPGAPGALAAVA